MSQVNRIDGGQIDRSQRLNFTFDGQPLEGYEGDTLASALLANDKLLVARSFKYHRPRGLFTSGSEEPNALMAIHRNGTIEPNTRATTVSLYEGLVAKSQNHVGPLKYDFMAINDFFSPLLGAGFYYKTFMWPKKFWESVYEPIIRNSAGLGRLNMEEDPEEYDHGYKHCDILIIGAGPSGLQAALVAGRAGAKVVLADEDSTMGGRLNMDKILVDEVAGADWAREAVNELESLSNVTLMPRTTVYGAYDHGVYGVLERKTDHLKDSGGKPRQVAWRVYTKAALLAAGATERGISFNNNDRPGIMLAGAVRAYANRWATLVGKKTAVYTNNDDGLRTAIDLQAHGAEIAAVIDTRAEGGLLSLEGVPIFHGQSVVDTKGRHAIKEITLSNGEKIEADCLAVSGGWNPNVHLTCHQGAKPVWDDSIASFIPGDQLPPGMRVIGSAKGIFDTSECFDDANKTCTAILKDLDIKSAKSSKSTEASIPKSENQSYAIEPYWFEKKHSKRAWIDLQNDVTVKDIQLAYKEGFESVEHVKRYTTLGMATDQGKTANVIAIAVMADITQKDIPDTGTTVFRPPYTPVAIGALGGRIRGKQYRPTRYPPSHQWAMRNGATFVEAGQWMRSQWFTREGEANWRDSVDREALAVRNSVGVCDVSTLGKIDIKGSDATDFINRVYANGFAKLGVSKVRYGIMLREDGMAFDDGTTARMGEHHYIMTTTTVNAGPVFRHLEFCRQCLWPDLDVHLISTTDQFAQYAVAGPNSRALLEKIVDEEFDISNEAFPFMACGDITICGGIEARLFRISFSGEMAYEIAVNARYGDSLMDALMQQGEEFGVTPYGTEALSVLRIEKGHPVASELNGQTTALNLGLGRMVLQTKDSIGSVLSNREGLLLEDGYRLVGVKPIEPNKKVIAGAHFIEADTSEELENDLGWITSACFSPNLETYIALGFLKNGSNRLGERLIVTDPLSDTRIEVEIVSPHFIDPDGERLRV